MSIKLKKPLFDQIWPQFLFSSEFSEFDEKITKDCYDLQKTHPKSVTKSNIQGWQSEVFSDTGSESIIELKNCLIEVCNETITNLTGLKFKVKSADWWVNINSKCSFNVPHSHGAAKIVGVYYPQLPKKPGSLTLYRPDRNDNLRNYDGTSLDLTPEKSRAYLFPGHILHAVQPNESWEIDRISIAFNFY